MYKKMFDLENDGKGHGIQHSQWRHSIANINVGKSHLTHFIIALTDSDYIDVSNL